VPTNLHHVNREALGRGGLQPRLGGRQRGPGPPALRPPLHSHPHLAPPGTGHPVASLQQGKGSPRPRCSSCSQLAGAPPGPATAGTLGSRCFSTNKEKPKREDKDQDFLQNHGQLHCNGSNRLRCAMKPEMSTGHFSGESGHENCYTSMNCHCWVPSTRSVHRTL